MSAETAQEMATQPPKMREFNPHHRRGYEALKQGHYEEAALHFEQYARAVPEEAEPHHLLGNAYAEVHRFQEAVKAYERGSRVYWDQGAFKKAPDSKVMWFACALHYNYGNALAAVGQHQKAEEMFGVALQGSGIPQRQVYKNMGNSAFTLGAYERAYEAFKRGKDLSEGADLNLAMGNCKVLQGKFKEAQECYDAPLPLLSKKQCAEHCRENGELIAEISSVLGECAQPCARKERIVYFEGPARGAQEQKSRSPFDFMGMQGNTGNIPGGDGYEGLPSFAVVIIDGATTS